MTVNNQAIDDTLQVDSQLITSSITVTATNWKRVFIKELMEHGIFAVAARAVGKRPSVIRHEMSVDKDFRDWVADAMEIAAGDLELAARVRAKTESDPLMIRLLEVTQPERFRRDTPSTNVTFVKAYVGFTPDDWDKNDGVEVKQLTPPSEQVTDVVVVDDKATVIDADATNSAIQAVTVATETVNG